MEFLQESVLGDKIAVSANLLSLSQGISLNEAENILSEFFSKNKDVLDAAYKVFAKDGIRSSIRILGPEATKAEGLRSRIYIVSPQRASDPAVVAEVARRVKQLQLGMTVEKLARAGVCVNPLLDRDFIARTQRGAAAPAELLKPAVKVEDPAPANQSRNQQDGSTIKPESPQKRKPSLSTRQPQELPAQSKSAPSLSVGKSKKAQQNSNSSSNKASSGKPSSFPFKKTDKNEALMSGRRRQAMPVPERVIVSELADNEERDESTEIRANKEAEQLKNLAKLYDQEKEEPSVESCDMDIDAGSEDEDAIDDVPMELEEPLTTTMEPLIDDEPTPPSPDSEVATKRKSNEVDDNADTLQNATKEHGKPRTKRVLRTIVTQDEEGFDVRKQVYVEEPIDEKEASSSSSLQQSDTKALEQVSETNVLGERAKQVRRSKSPPTIRKGNQTSLMSFFTSKH